MRSSGVVGAKPAACFAAGQHTAAWGVLLAYLLRARPDVVVWSAWRFPIDGWGVRGRAPTPPRDGAGAGGPRARPLVEQPGQDGMYKTSSTTERALAPAYAALDTVLVLGESAKRILLETWPVDGAGTCHPHGDESIFTSGAGAIPDAEETIQGRLALSFGPITALQGHRTRCVRRGLRSGGCARRRAGDRGCAQRRYR